MPRPSVVFIARAAELVELGAVLAGELAGLGALRLVERGLCFEKGGVVDLVEAKPAGPAGVEPGLAAAGEHRVAPDVAHAHVLGRRLRPELADLLALPGVDVEQRGA